MDKNTGKTKYLKSQKFSRKTKKHQANQAAVNASKKENSKVKLREKLGNNWTRYDEDSFNAEETISSSKDFELLANASKGHYFQFQRDKSTFEDISNLQQQLFNLDLSLLSDSISSVPFHIRSGIDEQLFSTNELLRFWVKANENKNVYTQKYCGNIKNESEKEIIEAISEKLEEVLAEEDIEKETTAEDNKSKDQGEDYQQWLDDILDF